MHAPLGPFFGFDWETPDYAALPAGCKEGECYFYYPMPFRKNAILSLTSYLELPAMVTYAIEWAPTKPPEDLAYFFARWRHEVDSKSLDYPFIEVAGQGHLVGITLQVDHPIPGWWGEGDEKVWVDGDQFPKWIGTGSEDYFGDAWGIRYLSEPSFGCSLDKYPHTCPYRWHFMDLIPFSRRLRMTIENYGAWPKLEFDEFEYNSVAYWYQAELTPPFDKLVGKTYIGGEVYQQTPASYAYRTDRFPVITANDVYTSGLDIPFTIEAETILTGANNARIITDAQLPYQFNWERALDFGDVKTGAVLGDFKLGVSAGGVYLPTLYTAPEEGIAELGLQVGGMRLGVVNHPEAHIAELEAVLLPEGGDMAQLIVTTDGRAIIDCLRLEPAPKVENAIEAETVQIVGWVGTEVPCPSGALRGPSGGQMLEWRAGSIGDTLVLQMPQERQAMHVLGVQPIKGPDSPIIQAFAHGKPLGPPFDLYAPQRGASPPVLPLGPVPPESPVEIRVVGKNPASTAYHVSFDYFRWEPLLIHPESTLGVWAHVVHTEHCQYRIQDLGARFVGGHHFWVQPSAHNAYVDIGLIIPQEGDYLLETRYTTSYDYAILQAFLDEKPLGARVDLYTPTVLQTDVINLGRHHLTAGQHLLRFQAVDKNKASTGYLMGIDYVLVREAE
ncbi:MAG: glycoside hydrolase family 172 protein [Candidatus Zipacnadales bacterium]